MITRGDLRTSLSLNNRLAGKKHLYVVNHEIVAKGFKSKEEARHEYEMGMFLESKVSVPGNYQLVPRDNLLSKIFVTNPIDEWLVLMNRIHGKTVSKLKGKVRAEAILSFKKELEKVLSFGIYPGDTHSENVLYDEIKGKVYLIDFWAWHPTQDMEKLAIAYEWLRRKDPLEHTLVTRYE